jgi:hypothetical protein
MVTDPDAVDVDLVECEVCLKSIPKSEAQSAEVRDYVVFFCDQKCYDEWVDEQSEEHTREGGEP